MINLLPPNVKQSYRFAERNTKLRHWVVATIIAFIGLGLLGTYGMLTLHQSTVSLNKEVAANDAMFKREKYTQTQAQVEDITNSFRLVVQVLSKEVLFSELIKQIGTTIPYNASLAGLNINQVQGGIDISALATDYNTATQVQVNLADPANKIFEKADIVNITCQAKSAQQANSKYPCTVTIRALFAKNNPFLFINTKGATP